MEQRSMRRQLVTSPRNPLANPRIWHLANRDQPRFFASGLGRFPPPPRGLRLSLRARVERARGPHAWPHVTQHELVSWGLRVLLTGHRGLYYVLEARSLLEAAACWLLLVASTRKRRPYGAQCVAVEGGAAAPGRSRCSRLRARLPARRTSGPTARAAFVFCARRPHCSARRTASA